MYRYNFSVHFFKQDAKIVILSGEKKLTIEGTESLYDFLVFCLNNIHISTNILEKYNISPSMLELLIQHDIILKVGEYQSGIEAINFHSTSHHLTKLTSPVDEDHIDALYAKVEDKLSTIINSDIFLQKDIKSFDTIPPLKIDIFDEIDSGLRTTRLKQKEYDAVDLDYLYSALKYINSKHNDHFIYGSGGGFYATFCITITSNDWVYIADKHKQVIYQSTVIGIFDHISSLVLSTMRVDPKSYNSIVLLVSDTGLVLKKYGNKGYKFLAMEAGSIGLLRRILYSKRGYAELGGYKNKDILQSIQSFFTNPSDIIMTHLILLSR